ncbi:hypothetical protein ACFXKS_20440 [Streptomyces scopuliridis]|uniref:hypothetical protein n=1 Tax=Streptomyces scopuliridis TaxID=452529 RepID=UPI003691088B
MSWLEQVRGRHGALATATVLIAGAALPGTAPAHAATSVPRPTPARPHRPPPRQRAVGSVAVARFELSTP